MRFHRAPCGCGAWWSRSRRRRQCVPGILVEVGPRLLHELVQVLKLLAAGAELDGLRRNAGRLVHGVLPGSGWLFALGFAYRVPRLRAIPKIAFAATRDSRAR